MDLGQFDRSYLLEQYREFYAVVLHFKEQIETRAAGAEEEVAVIEPDAQLEPGLEDGEVREMGPGGARAPLTAEHIHAELLDTLQKQAQAIVRRGEENEQKRFKEIQYVMAAAADEVFLHLNWDGKDYWAANLLEEEIFHTHNAGERFFVNLEELLKQRDPTRAEVAAAYLLALSLGFRGKYQDIQGDARLQYFRLQLFATLFHRHPGLSEDAQLFPQANAHTLSGKEAQWLPRLRPWLMALVAVVAGYVAISHLMWQRESDRIDSVVERINSQRAAGANKKVSQRPSTSPGSSAVQ